jgi:hypothetical protein
MRMDRLALPQVTLCAISSVNVDATIRALERCLAQIAFGDAIFFTDAHVVPDHPEIRVVPIDRLPSAAAYSRFVLEILPNMITSSHCLLVQWDGFVVDASRWKRSFLDFDYIGASWPQFADSHRVGNGGFSLRSARLLKACQDPDFASDHPEDIAICRQNRQFLEQRYDIQIADQAVADHFSFERNKVAGPTFGYHGVFNMIQVLGTDEFWATYLLLDDRKSAFTDFQTIFREFGKGRHIWRRRLRFWWHYTRHLFSSI